MTKRPSLPPGRPPQPRYKQRKNRESKTVNFAEWLIPINDAAKRGLTFQNHEMDDTTAIITATHTLDTMLKFLIVLKFKTVPTEADTSDVFDYPAPLSSLAAKTTLCRVLGAIPKQVADELDILRDIRNKFCHSFSKRSFADADIKWKCGTLKFSEKIIAQHGLPRIQKVFARHQPLQRAQFFMSAMVVVLLIVQSIFDGIAETMSREKNAADIKQSAHDAYREWMDKNMADTAEREANEGKTTQRRTVEEVEAFTESMLKEPEQEPPQTPE